jgi:hypothetical protein
MCGMTAPGTTRTYYICPHNPNNPRHTAKTPDHVRAAFRDHVIYTAVDGILGALLSHDYADMLAGRLPATQDAVTARTDAAAEQLRRRIAQADTAITGLMTQLEQLGSDTSPAAAAYRDRIRDQFTARYDDKTAAQAELDTLTATQPPAEDPALLDELPYAPELLNGVPDEIRARIYAAFQVHALYRAQPHQATITATITDATPAIIQALLEDPRTDHDTADPARKNSPVAAMECDSFVIMKAGRLNTPPGIDTRCPFFRLAPGRSASSLYRSEEEAVPHSGIRCCLVAGRPARWKRGG